MPTERPNAIPDWAKRERASDLTWIQENLHVFFPAAQSEFGKLGRGAIVTDVTTLVSHPAGESHPFFYLPLVGIEEQKWGDAIRMVNAYDPTWELVTVLLKRGRESAYRVGVPALKK